MANKHLAAFKPKSVIKDQEFNGKKIEDCEICDVTFVDCKFKKCEVLETEFKSCTFERCDFNECIFDNCHIEDSIIREIGIGKCKIYEITATSLTMHELKVFHSELYHINLRISYIYNGYFIKNSFQYISIKTTNITCIRSFGNHLWILSSTDSTVSEGSFEADTFMVKNINRDDLKFNHVNFEACTGEENILPIHCPDSGSFVAFKAVRDGIAVLLIPDDARRSSAYGNKCRCDKAKVLQIYSINDTSKTIESAASFHDDNFIYTVGETVTSEFDECRWEECSRGIHFYMTYEEAVKYYNNKAFARFPFPFGRTYSKMNPYNTIGIMAKACLPMSYVSTEISDPSFDLPIYP